MLGHFSYPRGVVKIISNTMSFFLEQLCRYSRMGLEWQWEGERRGRAGRVNQHGCTFSLLLEG
jgi:hypothetical protein